VTAAPIEFDPDAMVFHVGSCSFALPVVEQLWSVVTVFPGLPDEIQQRWVLQVSDGVVLAPALSLPTARHVSKLSDWLKPQGGLYTLRSVGWPWGWRTIGWAWCAMRGRTERFDQSVWQRVRQTGVVEGPATLASALQVD
jgi:hypothetical protein